MTPTFPCVLMGASCQEHTPMHSELRTTLKRRAEDMHNLAGRENRNLTPAESSQFDALIARVTELDEQEARESAAAKHRVEMNGGARFYTSDSDVYSDPHQNHEGPSFFRDMRDA